MNQRPRRGHNTCLQSKQCTDGNRDRRYLVQFLFEGVPTISERSINASHVKLYWEIIADNPSKAGWSLGCVLVLDSNGRTIWVADAHCDDGKRCVVHADDKLTAFVELESEIRADRELV